MRLQGFIASYHLIWQGGKVNFFYSWIKCCVFIIVNRLSFTLTPQILEYFVRTQQIIVWPRWAHEQNEYWQNINNRTYKSYSELHGVGNTWSSVTLLFWWSCELISSLWQRLEWMDPGGYSYPGEHWYIPWKWTVIDLLGLPIPALHGHRTFHKWATVQRDAI